MVKQRFPPAIGSIVTIEVPDQWNMNGKKMYTCKVINLSREKGAGGDSIVIQFEAIRPASDKGHHFFIRYSA